MSERVGFIGLGIMGAPVAMNVLKAGFPLTVWNRTASRMTPLTDAGAAAGDSPRDVASRSDITITIVSDTPDVEEVILGGQGALSGAAKGSVIVDMSTISPSVTKRIAARCRENGVAMLDAPVSGGDTGAKAGTLSIMSGGEEETFERVRPVFEAMGRTVTHCGPSGSGQATKLCNQAIGALNLLAMCEGIVLGIKQGLDPERLLQAVSNGAAGSWALKNLAPRTVKGDLSPGFMVKLQQKDLRLVMEAARELKAAMPGTALVHQLLNSVEASGNGDLGIQALITVIQKLSELKPYGEEE